MSGSEAAVNLCDVIGSNGKYQMMALLVSTYTNALQGSFQIFLDLLAPDVDLYWDWDSNRTLFRSADCKMEDLENFRKMRNHSQASSRLVYLSQYSDHTLTEQFELICERSWMVSFAKSLSVWGGLPGSILFVVISERFGRRPVAISFCVLTVATNACILFQNNLVLFLSGCFILGTTVLPLCHSLMIEALEVFPTSRRAVYSTSSRYGAMVGQILQVGVLWLTRDWFHTQLFQTVFAATTLLLTLYLLESPTWLVVRGRYADAERNLLLIAERNKIPLEEVKPKIDLWIQQIKDQYTEPSESGSIRELFKNGVIARYTLFSAFIRLSCLVVNLGLTMNVQSFGQGLLMELTTSCALALVLGLTTALLLSRVSIRMLTMAFFLLLAITCAIYAITCMHPLARSVLSLTSRVLVIVPHQTSFVYLTEVLPTSVRMAGNSLMTTVCCLVSPLSPFTKELGERTWPWVPFVLFAGLSLISAALLLFLPETKGRPLKQNLRDLKEGNDNTPAINTVCNS